MLSRVICRSIPTSVLQHHSTGNSSNQITLSYNRMWPNNNDRNYSNNVLKQRSSATSIVLSSLLMGVLSGCLILAVLLPIWLSASVYKSTTSIGKYLEFFKGIFNCRLSVCFKFQLIDPLFISDSCKIV
jgi:hypothetical protein